ncbi:MAG TPA: hypothetical protein VMU81_02630 [Acetobacteraceae bacterium]|nr:hypothetical protein [Acetobacteraceae bacterium]
MSEFSTGTRATALRLKPKHRVNKLITVLSAHRPDEAGFLGYAKAEEALQVQLFVRRTLSD